MEHHFDAKESAKSFDDPASDAWQLPDRVIAALNLKQGQIVADKARAPGISRYYWRRRELRPRFTASISNHRW